jgi:hypothetical protein
VAVRVVSAAKVARVVLAPTWWIAPQAGRSCCRTSQVMAVRVPAASKAARVVRALVA